MRSYLRISPDLVLEKERDGYQPAAIAAYVALLCAGARQNPAGRFANRLVLRGHLGQHARFVTRLIEENDLEILADGSYSIVGWDQWQEGDWKVAERMKRVRANKRENRHAGIDAERNGGNSEDLSFSIEHSAFLAADAAPEQAPQGNGTVPPERIKKLREKSRELFGMGASS